MGIYLRKSISVGPLRFNISQSGIGISVGVTGLRFGTGPRGNYVHMGRDGLYYRTTLLPSSSLRQSPHLPPQPSTPEIPSRTHAPLEEIESADTSQLIDSSSQELLNELNRKRSKTRLWPFVAVISIMILSLSVLSDWATWQIGVLTIATVAGTYAAHTRDTLQKSVVLFL